MIFQYKPVCIPLEAFASKNKVLIIYDDILFLLQRDFTLLVCLFHWLCQYQICDLNILAVVNNVIVYAVISRDIDDEYQFAYSLPF